MFEKLIHLIGRVVRPESPMDGWTVFTDRYGDNNAKYICPSCHTETTFTLPRIYPDSKAVEQRKNEPPTPKCCKNVRAYPAGFASDIFDEFLSREYRAPDPLMDAKPMKLNTTEEEIYAGTTNKQNFLF